MNSTKKQKLAIVTGCNGFTGTYLTSFLRKRRKGVKIIGIDVQKKAVSDCDVYIKSNLREEFPVALQNMLDNSSKIFCFHLAGLIFEKNTEKMYKNNLTAAYNTFYSLVPHKEKTVILNVGSSAEYGYQGTRGIPESSQTDPVSSYGLCKLAQTKLAENFYRLYDLPIVMTRTFNVIGPGQVDRLVCGRIIKQIVHYKKKLNKEIVVMGTETYRDFLDIRDAVKGYVLLVEKGAPGEIYNVASGKGVKINKVLNTALEITGLNPVIVKRQNQDIAQDIHYQKGSIRKIRQKTGWKPSYVLKKSLKDMINFEIGK